MVKGARRDPVLTSGSREPPDARDTLVAVGNHTGSRPKAHACRCIAASASRISVSKISRTSALEMWNSRALSPETGQPRQPARAPSRPSRPDLLSRQLRTSRSAESSEPASSAGTSYESSRGSRPLLGVIVRPPSGRSQGRAEPVPAASAMGRAYPPVSWAQHDVEAPTSRRLSHRGAIALIGRRSSLERRWADRSALRSASTARSACSSWAKANPALTTMTATIASAIGTIPATQARIEAAHRSRASGCVNWRARSRRWLRRPRRRISATTRR